MKTVLCVPGHDEKKVAKCRSYGADLIQFDLEDSVPDAAKDRARSIVASAATPIDSVRVNSAYPMKAFDAAAVRDSTGSIGLPKEDWRSWLDDISTLNLGAVVPIVETASSLLLALSEFRALRAARVPMLALAFGADDYATSVHGQRNCTHAAHARADVALLAAALGVECIDSPCVVLNEGTVRAEVRSAHELGYTWKIVIHPIQIEWVQAESARIEAEERARASQVLRSYENQAEAVTMLDKELVTPPLAKRMRSIQ